MSEDEATRELWRRAGTGDLNAAVDYVIALMRGTPPMNPSAITVYWAPAPAVEPPPEACRWFLKPRTAEELRASPVLTAREVFAERLPVDQAQRDMLARWLLVHQGKIVNAAYDPIGFEAVEPADEIRRLRVAVEKYRERLLPLVIDPNPVWVARIRDVKRSFRAGFRRTLKPLEARRLAERAYREIQEWRAERSRCRGEGSRRTGQDRADRIELRLRRLQRVYDGARAIWESSKASAA